MSNINYGVLKRYGYSYPQFDYIKTREDNPVYLLNNHKYVQAQEALEKVGGECRAEIINGVWMLIYYKLGSFTGCIMDSNWRKAPSKFFDLMLEANIIKQTLF